MNPFCCPACKSTLALDSDNLVCRSCGKAHGLQHGVPCFSLVDDGAHGEFDAVEMAALIRIASQQNWKTALREFLDKHSPAVAALIFDQSRSTFISLLDLPKEPRVLDIGCGFGALSLQLAESAREVVALDNTFDRVHFLNVAAAQEGKTNIKPAYNGDILNLPLNSDYFDLAFMIGVLEYLPIGLPHLSIKQAFDACIKEVNRVLKPGGYLYIGTKNRYGWQYLLGAMDHNGLRFGPPLPLWLSNALCRFIHGRDYRIVVHSLREYEQLLTQNGFERPLFYWPVPGYQTPRRFYLLSDSDKALDDWVRSPSHSLAKRAILSSANKLWMLRNVVPHYGIVARKAIAAR